MALPPPKPQGNAAPLADEDGKAPTTDAGGDGTVSPEEQKEYDLFMEKVGDILYGTGETEGQIMPEILESLSGAKEPPAQDETSGQPVGNPAVMALANTAVQVVQKIDTASHEANAPVSDDVLYHGAVETIEMLAEIAETAGFHEYSEEELSGALYQAVDMYRPIAQELGRTSEETLKGQFKEVTEADANGRLGDLIPGLGNATVGEPPVQAE